MALQLAVEVFLLSACALFVDANPQKSANSQKSAV